METAFADAAADAVQQGIMPLIRLVLQEIADWPGALLREHWEDVLRRRKEVHMLEMVSSFAGVGGASENNPQPGTWKDTWRAGIPHFLVLLFATFAMFLQNASFMADEHGMGTLISMTITVLFWIILLSTLGRSFWMAYNEGWPRWSASWFGYLFVLVAAPVILILQETNNATVRGLDQFYFGAILPVVLAGLLYFLVRKDWIKTLMVVAPFAILLWMPVLEFVPNPIRYPLNLWMFAVVTGVSMAIVRMGNWQKGIWWMMGGSLLVGLPVAYARVFHAVLPEFHIDLSTPLDMVNLLLTTLFWSGMLIFGPMLLGTLWKEGQQIGGQGKLRYRVMIAGFAFNLVGNVFLLQTQVLNRASAMWQSTLSWMILLGLVLLFFGGVTLASAAWYTGERANRWRPVWLSILMLGFPITLMFPLFFVHRWFLFSPLPAGLFVQYNVPEGLPYGLGLVWLLLTGWLVSRNPVVKVN